MDDDIVPPPPSMLPVPVVVMLTKPLPAVMFCDTPTVPPALIVTLLLPLVMPTVFTVPTFTASVSV